MSLWVLSPVFVKFTLIFTLALTFTFTFTLTFTHTFCYLFALHFSYVNALSYDILTY